MPPFHIGLKLQVLQKEQMVKICHVINVVPYCGCAYSVIYEFKHVHIHIFEYLQWICC